MSNVIEFPGETRQPLDPDKVLEGMKGQCSYVLILGWGKEEDGEPFIASSSTSDLRDSFYAIETYKHFIMRSKWDEENGE